jgi:hypothetical protein
VLTRVRVASAAGLPPPGTAAVEIILGDLTILSARTAVETLCGPHVLRLLEQQSVRWVAVMVGHGGVAVLPCDTAEEMTNACANASVDFSVRYGAVVVLPLVARELRQKLVDAARMRELEVGETRGAA